MHTDMVICTEHQHNMVHTSSSLEFSTVYTCQKLCKSVGSRPRQCYCDNNIAYFFLDHPVNKNHRWTWNLSLNADPKRHQTKINKLGLTLYKVCLANRASSQISYPRFQIRSCRHSNRHRNSRCRLHAAESPEIMQHTSSTFSGVTRIWCEKGHKTKRK